MLPGGEQRRGNLSDIKKVSKPQEVGAIQYSSKLHGHWSQHVPRASVPNATSSFPVTIPEMATGQPMSGSPTMTKLFRSPSCPSAPLSSTNQQAPTEKDSAVVHQGMLRKKPHAHMWTDNPWPVRYFFLKPTVLVRYKDRSLAKKTEFPLKGATIQYGGFGRDTIFRLCSPLRQWTLAAPSGGEAQTWIVALQEAIRRANEEA